MPNPAHPKNGGSTPDRLIIRKTSGWSALKLPELWEYRELLYFFVWRDIKVRYKQTVLGAIWAIIQPFMTMIVFSLFFGGLIKVPSDGVPYPIFAYTALIPWTFFSNGLSNAANSMVSNANMVKKIYFPRLLVPVASVITGLVDFALAFVVLLGMMFYFGIVPTLALTLLPLLVLMLLSVTLGMGLWLAAMNVQFRDIRYTLPFLTQFVMFATPVVYSSTIISNPVLRLLYALNPMAGIIEGFRWVLLGIAPGPSILVSAIMAGLILVSGAFYFRRLERTFADML